MIEHITRIGIKARILKALYRHFVAKVELSTRKGLAATVVARGIRDFMSCLCRDMVPDVIVILDDVGIEVLYLHPLAVAQNRNRVPFVPIDFGGQLIRFFSESLDIRSGVPPHIARVDAQSMLVEIPLLRQCAFVCHDVRLAVFAGVMEPYGNCSLIYSPLCDEGYVAIGHGHARRTCRIEGPIGLIQPPGEHLTFFRRFPDEGNPAANLLHARLRIRCAVGKNASVHVVRQRFRIG